MFLSFFIIFVVLGGVLWLLLLLLSLLLLSSCGLYSSAELLAIFNGISVCGNKLPTRRNRGFYCRSYCLLNMFRASPCPSSGAQEYYTVVAACYILCCGFSSSWSGVELRVMCPVCRMQTGRITLSYAPDQLLEKPQHKIPHAATTV